MRQIHLMRPAVLALAFTAIGLTSAAAGDVTIWGAKAIRTEEAKGAGVWQFEVTLGHVDTGWDHYADRYDILTPDGELLGSRVLAHPHVEEQPFTRGVGGIVIPDGLESVLVRGHDKVHGDGEAIEVQLSR